MSLFSPSAQEAAQRYIDDQISRGMQNAMENNYRDSQMSALTGLYRGYGRPVTEPAVEMGTPTDTLKENNTMWNSIQRWYEKHSDILVTLAVALLADHLIFGGKFRGKIENLVEGLVDKATEKAKAHQL